MISLLAAAKATLRVIGLATVMHGNPGIDVVMPQVQTPTTHIEEHVAVLIVRKEELVGPTDGWTIKPYREGFSLIELTGEDVQFLPDAANPVAGVPFQLPRLTNGCIWKLPVKTAVAAGRSTGVHPGVQIDVFGLRPPLLESYRPPFYKAAAAVLRVPYGSTSACKAFVEKQKRDRIDTNIEWNTGGGVTIVGKRHEKRLRLEGDDVLIVAGNVPRSLINGFSAMKDHGHFKAYYTMLVANGRAGCGPQNPADGIPRCMVSTSASQTAPPPQTAPRRPVPGVLHVVTSECSNSQYP
jgi:hypothetical protein